MTTVSGIVRDTQGNAIPNAVVAVRYTKPVVGFDGGAAVQNVRVFTADGAGLVSMPDLVPGSYEATFYIAANANTSQQLLQVVALNVIDQETQTLESAIVATIGDVTPSVLQQAIDAKDAAIAAAAQVATPFATYVAAAAANIDAGVTTIRYFSGGVLCEAVRSGTPVCITTSDGATWGPAGGKPTYLQHFGIVTHDTEGAALAEGALMTSGQRGDRQARLAAAFGGGQGELIIRGRVEFFDRLIINPYRHVRLERGVDLDGLCASSRFNLSATDMIAGGLPNVRGCYIESLHIACDQTPAATSGLRADLINYPPALSAQRDFGKIGTLRVSRAMRVLEMVGTDAQNNGGWEIDRLELSSFVRGVRVNGPLHFVKIGHIDSWVFGLNANLMAIRNDGGNQHVLIERADNAEIQSIGAFQGGDIVINASAGLPVQMDLVKLDGDGAGLDLLSGDSVINNVYGTSAAGAQRPFKIRSVAGNHRIGAARLTGSEQNMIDGIGGNLSIGNATINHLNSSLRGVRARVAANVHIDDLLILGHGRGAASATVTITEADPAVLTWTGHDLVNTQPVVLTTTGTLPAPLVAGTTYYVSGVSGDTFRLSATSGGDEIATTTAGTGTHTAVVARLATFARQDTGASMSLGNVRFATSVPLAGQPLVEYTADAARNMLDAPLLPPSMAAFTTTWPLGAYRAGNVFSPRMGEATLTNKTIVGGFISGVERVVTPEDFLQVGGDDGTALEAAIEAAIDGARDLVLSRRYNVGPLVIPANERITIRGVSDMSPADTGFADGPSLVMESGANASVITVNPTDKISQFRGFAVSGNQAGQASGRSFCIDIVDRVTTGSRAPLMQYLRLERGRSGGIYAGANRNGGELFRSLIQTCGFNSDASPVSEFGDGLVLSANNDWRIDRTDIGGCTRNGLYNVGGQNLVMYSTMMYSNLQSGYRHDADASNARLIGCMTDRNRRYGVDATGKTGTDDRPFFLELIGHFFTGNGQEANDTYSDIRLTNFNGVQSEAQLVSPTFQVVGGVANKVKHNIEVAGTTARVPVIGSIHRTDAGASFVTSYCNDESKLVQSSSSRGIAHRGVIAQTSGSARGANATDLQVSRSTDAQVASGAGSSVLGGENNTASGNNSVAMGSGNIASGAVSVATGNAAATRSTRGKRAHASGQFAAVGDAQAADHVMRRVTDSATTTSLTTDGAAPTGDAANSINIPANSTYAVEVTVTGREAATGDSAILRVTGMVRRGATVGTTTLVGAATTALAADAGASTWTATLSADNTRGSIFVRVTGEAAKTINWVAHVRTVEVTA